MNIQVIFRLAAISWIAGLISGCGTESASDPITEVNQAPVITQLLLQPDPAYTTSNLQVSTTATDADQDLLSWTYEWRVNDVLVAGATSNELVSTHFVKHDSVQVKATVDDGNATDSAIDTISIQDSAPVITQLLLQPDPTFATSNLQVSATATDADQDSLSWTYEWRVNDVLVADATSNELVSTHFVKHDSVQVKATVDDGDATDSAIDTISIPDSAPVITQFLLQPDPAYTTSNLQVSATATDADQDSLSWTFEWRVNDVLVAGATSNELVSTHFVKHDFIQVNATVDDGNATDSAFDTISIQDSAPVASISGVTQLMQGESLSVQIDATDADNDPITYSLVYGPTGLEMDSNGALSWTATGSRFSEVTEFPFRVNVITDDTVLVFEDTIQVTDPNHQYPLSRSGVEVPRFNGGMEVGDFNKDTVTEILLTDNMRRLYTLVFDTDKYIQEWYYPYTLHADSQIEALTAGNLDLDSKLEFMVATVRSSYPYDSRIHVLDGISREVVQSVSENYEGIHGLTAFDVDGDGSLEILYLGETGSTSRQLVIRDSNLNLIWKSSDLALGSSLSAGNVDNDADIEIVTGGGFVYGPDGFGGYSNEWMYGADFGFQIQVDDLDDNGIDEIVGLVDWTAVRVYNAVSRLMVAEVTASDLSSLVLADVDGDLKPEVITGDGQWGDVNVYSMNSPNALTLDATLDSQDHSVSSLSTGDVDDDGKIEILWGTGITSSGEDSLVVAGFNPGLAVEWQNVAPSQLDGPYIGGQETFLSAGVTSLTFAVSNTDSSYEGSRIINMAPDTGALSLSSEQGSNWNDYIAIDTTDFDGDGVSETFIATSSLYTPYFTVYNFNGDVTEWTSPADFEMGVAVAHGDFTGDNNDEFVTITSNGYIYVFNVVGSTLFWSTQFGNTGQDVVVADLNNDNVNEIITAASGTVNIYSQQGAGFVSGGSRAIADAYDIAVGDLDQDGAVEIIVLTNSYSGSEIVVMNSSLEIQAQYSLAEEATGLYIEDPESSGIKNIVLTLKSGEFMNASGYVVVMDPLSGTEISRSPMLNGKIPKHSLWYIDVDEDGITEISYGTDYSMNLTR